MPLPYKIATLLYCFNQQDEALLLRRNAEAQPRLVEPVRRQAAHGRGRIALRLRLPRGRGGNRLETDARAICI